MGHLKNIIRSARVKTLITFILGIFIACSFIQQRTMVKQCEVSLKRIWVTDISLSDITVRIKLRIKNNTDVDVIIDNIDAQLFMDDVESGDITFKGASIKARQLAVVEVFTTFTYKQLKDTAKYFFKNRGKIKYRFVGVADIDSPFGKMKYPFDFKYNSEQANEQKLERDVSN